MRKIWFGLCFVLASCATQNAGTEIQSADTPGAKSRVEVFLSENCVMDPSASGTQSVLLSAIGSALIGAFVDQGLSSFSKLLHGAADEKVTKTEGGKIVDLMDWVEAEQQPYNVVLPAEDGTIPVGEDGTPVRTEIKPHKLATSSEFSCILVVAGEFTSQQLVQGYNSVPGGANRPATEFSKLEDRSTAKPDEILAHLIAHKIGLSSAPDFVFEGRIEQSKSGEALWIEPNFLHLAKFQSADSRSAERTLTLILAVDSPRTRADASTLRAMTLNFGMLRPGVNLIRGNFPKDQRTALQRVITPDDAAKSASARASELESSIVVLDANIAATQLLLQYAEEDLAGEADVDKKKALERLIAKYTASIKADQRSLQYQAENYRGFGLSPQAGFMPVEINATLVETREERRMLKFIANVFDSASKDAGAAIKDELDPKRREEASEEKKTEAEALEDKLHAARVAYLEAKKAFEGLADDPNVYDREIAGQELLHALAVYNRARLALDLPALLDED